MVETELIQMIGQVDAIYFENPNNFYKVIRVLLDQSANPSWSAEEIVMTGQFAALHLDTRYEFWGRLIVHPKYGEQFQVVRYQQVSPTSKAGLIEYLSSERFKGVGQVLAERIVDQLGMDAIDKILDDASCLKDIQGLSEKTATNLFEVLKTHKGTERIFIQLSQWGFGSTLAERIYQRWTVDTLNVIKENPYELAQEIEGISFNRADAIAEQLGIEALSLQRVVAGLYTVVAEKCLSEGDTYVDQEVALKLARQRLENSRPALIHSDLLEQALNSALDQERLFRYQAGLSIASLYLAEKGIAHRLKDYISYNDVEIYSEAEVDQCLNQVKELTGIDYDSSQLAALKLAINSPCSIITGGPGTGKTTLIKGLILLHSLLHDYPLEKYIAKKEALPILLAAPTGRAAQRMSETTGLPAMTIHRMLGYTREVRRDDAPMTEELEGSLLIIDEMSMVDTWLMHWLMQAVPYQMQIVLVGDRDQLPSVGPGKVFEDLIESDQIPTIALQKIYRQAEDSSIIHLAHQVRQGKLPYNFLVKQTDRAFIQASSQQVSFVIEQVVANAYAKGFDSHNLQVLAPMYKGPAGINALNIMLQNLLNPAQEKKRQIEHFEHIYRRGDKVIQLINNTEEGVFNGDIGHITAIFTEKETESKQPEILVEFDDDRELVYRKSDLDQLALAYCTSIHKAQGSEYDLVILPLVDLYSRLLRKDILYTAITRAQKSLVMIGNPQSFFKAVQQEQEKRHTHLQTWLKEVFINRTTQSSSFAFEQDEVETIESNSAPSSAEINLRLTLDNYQGIDPMIGMGDCCPQDFMVETLPNKQNEE